MDAKAKAAWQTSYWLRKTTRAAPISINSRRIRNLNTRRILKLKRTIMLFPLTVIVKALIKISWIKF